MRQCYQHTGKRNSTGSVSVWKAATNSTSSPSTWQLAPCTLWSLMGNIAQPHWTGTNGSHCFLQVPHYNQTATWKDLTHCVQVLAPNEPGLESVSLVTNRMTAPPVIPGSVLVLEVILTTGTRVEMWQDGEQIMGIATSKLWATFLFNNEEIIAPIWFQKEWTVFFLSKAKHKRDCNSQVMSKDKLMSKCFVLNGCLCTYQPQNVLCTAKNNTFPKSTIKAIENVEFLPL